MGFQRSRLLPPVLLLSLAVAIAGCDGGGDASVPASSTGGAGSVSGGSSTPAVTYTSHVVAPSLGLIQNGLVKISKLDGTELATAFTNHTGLATLNVPADATGPFLIEISGNAAATYFDEALAADVPLPSGQTIRALVENLGSLGTGVTPLTEMAVQYLEEQNGSLAALSAAQIAAANEFVRTQLAPEIADITLPPAIIGAIGDAALLDQSAPSLYALKLAALARVANANHTLSERPALDILRELGKDLADGHFDGIAGGLPTTLQTYQPGTFATQLHSLAQSYSGAGPISEFFSNLTQYVSPQILARLTPPATGGEGSGTTGSGDTGNSSGTPSRDLLASWAGTYRGSFSQTVTGNVLYTGMFSSAVKTVLGVSSNQCSVKVENNRVLAGLQSLEYASDLAATAVNNARRFMLGGTLANGGGLFGMLDGVGLPFPQVTSSIRTEGDLPVAFTFSVAMPFPMTLNYSGTCTFTN